MEKCVFCHSNQISVTVKKDDMIRYSCKTCGTKTEKHKKDLKEIWNLNITNFLKDYVKL